MRIPNVIQIEILLPVRPLLRERLDTKAGFHPCDSAVGQFTCRGHVPLVLVAGHGPGAETPIVNRPMQSIPVAWLDPSSHQIAHRQW